MRERQGLLLRLFGTQSDDACCCLALDELTCHHQPSRWWQTALLGHDLAAARSTPHASTGAQAKTRSTGHTIHVSRQLVAHDVPHLGLEHRLAWTHDVPLCRAARDAFGDAKCTRAVPVDEPSCGHRRDGAAFRELVRVGYSLAAWERTSVRGARRGQLEVLGSHKVAELLSEEPVACQLAANHRVNAWPSIACMVDDLVLAR
jgi:hypothetical protein